MAVRTPRPLDPDRGFFTQTARVFTGDVRRRKAEALTKVDRERAEETRLANLENVASQIEARDRAATVAEAEERRRAGEQERAEAGEEGEEQVTTIEMRPRRPALSQTPRRPPRVGVEGKFQFPRDERLQERIAGPFPRDPSPREPVTGVGVEGRFSLPRDPRLEESTRERPEIVTTRRRAGPDFSDIEGILRLPSGTLAKAFQQNPAGTISAILRELPEDSGVDLSALRSAINTAIQGKRAQIDNTVDPAIVARLSEEIEDLTQGLLDVTLGDLPPGATLEELIDRVATLDMTEQEKVIAIEEFMRRREAREETFGRFGGRQRGNREPLEPNRDDI